MPNSQKPRKAPKKTPEGQVIPQAHKSKEQIEAEIAQAKEVKRQRDLVTSKLWPLLVRGTTSISNATQFLGTLQMTVRQSFNNQMRTMKLSDLKIVESIDPKAPQADYYSEFLTELQGESVATVSGLIDGLNNELERLFRKEMAERALSSLKTDFIEDAK